MMYQWRPEMVTFMKEASAYNQFHEIYAKHIHKYQKGETHICDAGCGLGYLSLALAKYYSQVTAVDIASRPLEVLRENISVQAIHQIEVIEGDLKTYCPPKPFEAMVFCFYGSLDEVLSLAKKQCSGQIYIIKRNWTHHRFSLENKEIERFTHDESKAYLQMRKIPFQEELIEVEMGQPFRDFESAINFFKLYSRVELSEEDLIKTLSSKLVENGSGEYPLYLPMKRTVGLTVISVKDIPKDF